MPIIPATEWHYNIAQEICAGAPRVVGISAYMWNLEESLCVAHYIHQIMPSVLIVLGGPEAYDAANASALLSANPALDVVVFGEGELSFQRILQHVILGEGTLAQVPFAAYREPAPKGRRLPLAQEATPTAEPARAIMVSQSREVVDDIDQIPSPILSQSLEQLRGAGPLAFMATSRGCPVDCAFCVYSVGMVSSGKAVRFHHPERVMAELEHIRAAGLREIFFGDAIFTLNKRYVMPVLKYFLEDFTDARIAFEQKLDVMSPDVLPSIRELGHQGRIAHLDAGIQSTDRKVLKMASRRGSLDRFLSNLRKLELRPGPGLQIDLMVGLPGDTLEGFIGSLDFVQSEVFGDACPPTAVMCASLAVLKGTTYHQQAATLGIHYEPVTPYTVLRTATMSAQELRKARVVVNALEVISATVQLLRRHEVALPKIFASIFHPEYFEQAERNGWSNTAAHHFAAVQGCRAFVEEHVADPDLRAFAGEILDFSYLASGSVSHRTPAQWLRIPSLHRLGAGTDAGADAGQEPPSTAFAMANRFDEAHHFYLEHGFQLSERNHGLPQETSPAYLLLGPDGLTFLPPDSHRLMDLLNERFSDLGAIVSLARGADACGDLEDSDIAEALDDLAGGGFLRARQPAIAAE